MYIFQQGETIRIPLLLQEGNPDLITNVRANLKASRNKIVPSLEAPIEASFTVLPAFTGGSSGWILELTAAVSATLKPGLYVVNAAMEVSGTTVITDPSYITIQPSTTI